MRSKQPHSVRIGISWAASARTSLRWSMDMSRLPMGKCLAGRADVAAHVGQDGSHGREHPADEQVGQVAHHRRAQVDQGGEVGRERREHRGDDAVPLLPRRRADAVAIDQPEGVPGVVVDELDGDRPAHGVAEHDDRAGLDLVQHGHDLIGQHLHRHVVPVERIAPAESGQAGVDDPPAELFGQAGALPPVHAAAGEVAVDVDGPDRRGARAVGPMGPDVVGHGELQQAPLDPHGVRAACGWSGSCAPCARTGHG